MTSTGIREATSRCWVSAPQVFPLSEGLEAIQRAQTTGVVKVQIDTTA